MKTFSAGFEALRYVPRGWKLFGLPFWYAYIPFAFFSRLAGAQGEIVEAAGRYLLVSKGRVIREITAQQAFAIRADHLAAASARARGPQTRDHEPAQ